MNNNTNGKRFAALIGFGAATLVGLKSNNILLQIGAAFGSSYAFNEFTKTIRK